MNEAIEIINLLGLNRSSIDYLMENPDELEPDNQLFELDLMEWYYDEAHHDFNPYRFTDMRYRFTDTGKELSKFFKENLKHD